VLTGPVTEAHLVRYDLSIPDTRHEEYVE
jgi:hypothetical protein